MIPVPTPGPDGGAGSTLPKSGAAPTATLKSALLALGLALALLWPALLNGGPLIFVDTLGYLRQGGIGVALVVDKIAETLPLAADHETGAAQVARRGEKYFRAIVYQAMIYLGSRSPLGFTGAVLLQSAVVVALICMIAGREAATRPIAAAAAAAFCVLLTSAPWTVSTLMPDVFAAVAILCAMIVAARLERLGLVEKAFVFGAASLAALSHYGHPPLYLAASAAALLALLAQGRLSVSAVALTAGPLLTAAVASLGVAQAMFDEPSLAPKRLPLLLARSMEDGPALWHLEAHCDEYRYAVCELWDGEIPDNLGELLWSPNSLMKQSTDEQMARIRQEEFLILRRAFMEYPAAQTWSFVGNAARQTVMIGLGDTSWGRVVEAPDGRFVREANGPPDSAGLAGVGLAQKVVVLGSLGLLALWIVKDGLRVGDRERALLFVAVVGLGANAAIFGGLSAPVDRYQMRVIWIVPMLAAVFWLARRGAVAARGGDHG